MQRCSMQRCSMHDSLLEYTILTVVLITFHYLTEVEAWKTGKPAPYTFICVYSYHGTIICVYSYHFMCYRIILR
jgi:hypothetical protein